jgi:hypothetical protein
MTYVLFCLCQIICTTTTLLTCTWITFEYQYTFRTRSFGVLSTTDATMDWKEYLSLSVTCYYIFLCMSDVHTYWSIVKGTAGPFWYGDKVWHWLRQTVLFYMFQLCSARFGEVISSSLWRWCVTEVTQMFFSVVSCIVWNALF